jgi:hypothetical protein
MLKSPSILTTPTPEEMMLLYISTTTQVVSAVLVVEREELGRSQKLQWPMYFVSEVLSDSKTCYSHMQKLVCAILMTKRKLRHYFNADPSPWCLSIFSGRSSRTLRPREGLPSGRSS